MQPSAIWGARSRASSPLVLCPERLGLQPSPPSPQESKFSAPTSGLERSGHPDAWWAPEFWSHFCSRRGSRGEPVGCGAQVDRWPRKGQGSASPHSSGVSSICFLFRLINLVPEEALLGLKEGSVSKSAAPDSSSSALILIFLLRSSPGRYTCKVRVHLWVGWQRTPASPSLPQLLLNHIPPLSCVSSSVDTPRHSGRNFFRRWQRRPRLLPHLQLLLNHSPPPLHPPPPCLPG